MHKRLRFRRTTLFALWLSAFLLGLAFARTKLDLSGWWILPVFLINIITFRKKSWLAVVCIIIFGLLVGWWRGAGYMQKLSYYDDFYQHAVVMQGTADNDAIYGSNSQLSFDLTHLQIIEPDNFDLAGKLSIKGFGPAAVYKGDHIQAEGKLYKTRGSKQGSISFAQLKVLAVVISPVDDVRREFQAGMQSALPEPLASFGLGLLIGQRNTLPQQVTKQLSAVGLTHIVAVSGYNLTILILAARRLLKKRSKYQSTIVAIALIGLFLLFAGSSPSIIRAAIVSILSLLGWYYGRTVRPMILILVAAAITAGFYPIYLWGDIGWYLSFLAFFGVLVIGPLITRRIYKTKEPTLVGFLVIESFSAQLMTIPIIMYIFGEVSIISLLANVLLVPLVPLAMGLTLVAGLAGMLIPQISGWFAWPTRVLLTYMLDMVSLLSRVPHALRQQLLKLWQMLLLYGFIMAWTLVLWHKTRVKNATPHQHLDAS